MNREQAKSTSFVVKRAWEPSSSSTTDRGQRLWIIGLTAGPSHQSGLWNITQASDGIRCILCRRTTLLSNRLTQEGR